VVVKLLIAMLLAAPGWHTVGSGRFSWGERWQLRVHAAPYGQQCVNLVPQQPLQRRCPSGSAWVYVDARSSENPCAGRAFVYGSLPPATARVTILHRMGWTLPSRTRLLEGGARARYFVTEVRARARPARHYGKEVLGYAVAHDARGRWLATRELTARDVVTTMLCDAPSRPSRR
jgi:hypothetical protein